MNQERIAKVPEKPKRIKAESRVGKGTGIWNVQC